MQVTINGKSHDLAESMSVADLLGELDLNPRFVAVEVNLALVPRGEHQQHQLSDGDQLEIVTLAGGG